MSDIIVNAHKLKHQKFAVDSFVIKNNRLERGYAVFTHGYTSHKGQIINWGHRLALEGFTSLIFDLPGHFLGSFEPWEDLEYFQNHVQELFFKGLEHIQKNKDLPVAFGGHSLGGLLSLKAFSKSDFLHGAAICVGLGANFDKDAPVHLFSTEFYQKTLDFRRQLVATCLSPDIIFPWILEEKKNLQISNKKIFLINGKDDVVVGEKGHDYFFNHLISQSNQVEVYRPARLPHHMPENAASFVFDAIKKI